MTITVQLPDTLGALASALAKRRNQTLVAYLQALVHNDAETSAIDVENDNISALIARIRATTKPLPPLRMPAGNPASLLKSSTTHTEHENWQDIQRALDEITQEAKELERTDHEQRLA